VTRPHPSSPILVFSRGDAAIASSVGAYWVLSQLALCSPIYFFTPRTASFAAFATRNFSTVLAGILIFCMKSLRPLRGGAMPKC
jgi:hypothetical protein